MNLASPINATTITNYRRKLKNILRRKSELGQKKSHKACLKIFLKISKWETSTNIELFLAIIHLCYMFSAHNCCKSSLCVSLVPVIEIK
jgi:hypothetical protein